MARCRRHTRSAEAGGARVWRVVFFPAERVYRGGESREVGRGRDAMSDGLELRRLPQILLVLVRRTIN